MTRTARAPGGPSSARPWMRHAGWAVGARVLLAAGGGYVVSALATAVASLLLPLVLPWSRAEAVVLATFCSFLLYTAIIVWVFAAVALRRVVVGLATATVLLAACLALLKGLT